jgi:predicted aconitase with swiveling domain
MERRILLKKMVIRGRKVVGGYAEGEALVARENFSGFGGLDRETGVIIDERHPLYGKSINGKILVMNGAKGSSSFSTFFHYIRLNKVGPLAILFNVTTSKMAMGAIVSHVPAMTDFDIDPLDSIEDGDWVKVDADEGVVEVVKKNAERKNIPSRQKTGSMAWLFQQAPPDLPGERPITAKENLRRVFTGEKPCWIPVWGIDNQGVWPDVVLEHPPYDGDGLDWFGAEWVMVEVAGGLTPKPGTRVISDFKKWKEEVKFPDLSKVDWEEDAKLQTARYDPDRMHTFHALEGLFERLHELMPFEETLFAFYDEPALLHEWFDAMVRYKIELFGKVFKYYDPIDSIIYGDDWGTQRSGFFSNEMFRETLMPHTKEIWDYVHAEGKFVELHSCGLTQQYIGEIIEMGCDAWTPQTNNDLDMLTRDYGERIALTVPIDGVETAATTAEARRLVRVFVDKYAPRGRIVAGGIWGAPEEITAAVYEELYEYSAAFYARLGAV